MICPGGHLKPLADYGKMSPAYISLKDEGSLRTAIAGSDVVVNLIGKHYETKHYVPLLVNATFEDVHVKAAETLARISREEDVKHFVHLSSIAATPESASMWARTKAEGEKLVAEQFPGAVIMKANQIYGEEDRLLNSFAVQAKIFPRLPLIEGGECSIESSTGLSVVRRKTRDSLGVCIYMCEYMAEYGLCGRGCEGESDLCWGCCESACDSCWQLERNVREC